MPIFKSTYNILKKFDEDEVFNPNWMDSDTLILPPKVDWDYQREMTIEDVDIWEVLYESSTGMGLYAAWMPYAEFYIVTTGLDWKNNPSVINGNSYRGRVIETYYGQGAQAKVQQRVKELGMAISLNKIWVEDTDMWLYANPEPTKIISLK
jgi:hypothetical protein